jgi:hypothetical protein
VHSHPLSSSSSVLAIGEIFIGKISGPHSDPCQIHVWESFSKVIEVCILIRSRRPSFAVVVVIIASL